MLRDRPAGPASTTQMDGGKVDRNDRKRVEIQ